MSLTAQQKAKLATASVLANLYERSGYGDLWDSLSDETREEIQQELSDILEEYFD